MFPHPPRRFAPKHRRGARRFVPFAFIFFSALLLFIGGSAAFLYAIFSEYTGVKNWWLLFCGAPSVVVVAAIAIVFTLLQRFGKPLGRIFDAIDAISEGNLSARAPEGGSGMFGELNKRFNKMAAELERAETQRRNLTADVAHELRTPLHIIQGNLEGMLDGVYEPTSENISNTLDETKLLARLVNDLQTLSLAEAGQLPLHPSAFLMADLANDLVSSFSAQAASSEIDLRAEISNPSKTINADYDRLNQALSNLTANALRHTPQGGSISIKTETTPNGVRVAVQDTGEGISAEELPFIFDRFWRGSKSRTERTNSGLGLAITKQLIQAHRGTIEAQSELGAGTKFTIELPDA